MKIFETKHNKELSVSGLDSNITKIEVLVLLKNLLSELLSAK